MANVIQEVQDILSSSLSIREKMAALQNVTTDRRPGKAEAESLIRGYVQHICDKRNALVKQYSAAVPGFTKHGKGYDYDFLKSIRTVWLPSRYDVGIYKFKNSGRACSAAAIVAETKGEKFARHCKALVPAHVFMATMRVLGWPEKVATEHREQYRNDIIRVSGEIATFVQETGLHADFWGKKADVFTAQKNGAVNAHQSAVMYTQAADCCFVVRQEGEISWDKYSKAWHRQHGPAREITARYIQVFRGGQEVSRIQLDGLRGQYLVNAMAEHLRLAPVKVSRSLKPVQINPFFAVEVLHTIGNVTLYRRIFGGETVDYCAVANGTTYHATTSSAALRGLRTKLDKQAAAETARLEAENKVLTAEYCHQTYGFCETGMASFCELNGLDYAGAYTVREIRAAVVANRAENCRTYATELRIIGITLKCK